MWRVLLIAIAFGVVSVPTFAQSVYVTAGAGVEISRQTRFESSGFDSEEFSGAETTAMVLRLGTQVGERWGVELEFARPFEIDKDITGGCCIAILAPGVAPAFPVEDQGQGQVVPGQILPPVFPSTTRMRLRNSAIGTLAWARQPVTGTVDLVYLGGLAFTRSVREMTVAYGGRGGSFSSSSETTGFDLSPVVGFEARIAMTDHVRLVPGVRMQGTSDAGSGTDGWLLRATVGLGWQF